MPAPRELLEKLLDRRDLSEAEARELLGHLTNAETPPAMETVPATDTQRTV